jgi:hypothetical protein
VSSSIADRRTSSLISQLDLGVLDTASFSAENLMARLSQGGRCLCENGKIVWCHSINKNRSRKRA